MYPCAICDGHFDTVDDLRDHCMKSHVTQKTDESGYKCIVCGTNNSLKKNDNYHRRQFCKQKNTCKQCFKNCCTKYNLRHHIRKMHSNKKKLKSEYKCVHCGNTFAGSISFEYHLQQSSSNLNVCEKCGKNLCTGKNWNAHYWKCRAGMEEEGNEAQE